MHGPISIKKNLCHTSLISLYSFGHANVQISGAKATTTHVELCAGDSIELSDKMGTSGEGQDMKKKSLLNATQNEPQKMVFLVVSGPYSAIIGVG